MNVRYRVELSQIERTELRALLGGGKHASRKLKRAQILLAADGGASDEEIARSVGVGGSTVYRTKRRFVEGNLERALSEEPRPGAERKLTGQGRSLAGGDSLRQSPGGPRPLDAQAAGGCDGQAHRAQEPVARDGSAAPGGK
jgi:transposase-like protein